MKQLPCMIRTI